MPRYKFVVAYEGTDFHGWQKQRVPGDDDQEGDVWLRTVQGAVEEALAHVLRERVSTLGASRTDAGVHAQGQVVAFDSAVEIPTERIVPAVNSRLPDDVQVVGASVVGPDFDPIKHATSKGYRYCLAHGVGGGQGANVLRPLFDRRTRAFTAYQLDAKRMDAAAQDFVGEHDFASITRKNHGRDSTVRTVHACRVVATGDHDLHVDVSGNGFLYNMVRIIVGTLIEIGRGRVAADAIPGILAARDRAAAGATVPPEGLCLMWVEYDTDSRG